MATKNIAEQAKEALAEARRINEDLKAEAEKREQMASQMRENTKRLNEIKGKLQS